MNLSYGFRRGRFVVSNDAGRQAVREGAMELLVLFEEFHSHMNFITVTKGFNGDK